MMIETDTYNRGGVTGRRGRNIQDQRLLVAT